MSEKSIRLAALKEACAAICPPCAAGHEAFSRIGTRTRRWHVGFGHQNWTDCPASEILNLIGPGKLAAEDAAMLAERVKP